MNSTAVFSNNPSYRGFLTPGWSCVEDVLTSMEDLSTLTEDCIFSAREPTDTMDSEMTFARQLRLYMGEKSLNASQVARLAGVSKQRISAWLAGQPPRDFEQVKKVARVLKVSIDHLCFGSGVIREDSTGQELMALNSNEWFSGIFEIKLRRIGSAKEKSGGDHDSD